MIEENMRLGFGFWKDENVFFGEHIKNRASRPLGAAREEEKSSPFVDRY
jgi:hypothetical protein